MGQVTHKNDLSVIGSMVEVKTSLNNMHPIYRTKKTQSSYYVSVHRVETKLKIYRPGDCESNLSVGYNIIMLQYKQMDLYQFHL